MVEVSVDEPLTDGEDYVTNGSSSPEAKRFAAFLFESGALMAYIINVLNLSNPSSHMASNPIDVFSWTSSPQGREFWESLYFKWGSSMQS
jgi:hypothetical protein